MAKAQKGDLIRVVRISEVNERIDYEHKYKVGEIYEVIATYEIGEGDDYEPMVRIASGELLYDAEYEIHRKAGEEDVPDVERIKIPLRNVIDATQIQDAVNSPNHYTQGRFETIEIIEEITQGYDDGYVAYCVGNALKYLARAPYKHSEPTEDISKAAKYIEFALARLQTQK